MPVSRAELIVVESHFRLHSNVLEKLFFGMIKIICMKIGQPQVEMDKRQTGTHRRRSLKFVDGWLIFLPVQMGLAHEEMEFSRVLANFYQLRKRPLLQIFAASLAGGVPNNIKVA